MLHFPQFVFCNTCLVSFSHVLNTLLLAVLHYRNRISLFSQWKQRGMYAMCMWTVQLLLVLSKMDSMFIYVPEFYVEALVNHLIHYVLK